MNRRSISAAIATALAAVPFTAFAKAPTLSEQDRIQAALAELEELSSVSSSILPRTLK
jgi:hypothetical protein